MPGVQEGQMPEGDADRQSLDQSIVSSRIDELREISEESARQRARALRQRGSAVSMRDEARAIRERSARDRPRRP